MGRISRRHEAVTSLSQRWAFTVALGALLFGGVAAPVAARAGAPTDPGREQESHAEGEGDQAKDKREEEGEHEEEDEPLHEIGFFIGSTQAEEEHGEREDPRFTLGIDYERRLTSAFGIGGFADFVFEGSREGLLGVPLFFHVLDATFVLAPSAQRARETGEWEYVTRLGFLWKFELRTFGLAPALYYDILEDEEFFVFGLTFIPKF